MFKKSILAISLLATSFIASAQNDVYGKIGDIFYNNSLNPDTPAIIVRLNIDPDYTSNNIESCMSDGFNIEWKLQLDNNIVIAQAQLARIEKAQKEGTIVRIMGDPNVCSGGSSVGEDKIVDLYPY
jgi:hypothetical protein